jgi:CheY-like chemotaxis protein
VPFDIEQLNERINSLYGVKAAEKDIELVFKKEGQVFPYVLGDPLRLEQVLGNLVSNAIKFTDQGKVTVSVECLGETDTTETLCFVVEDTGVGIPKSKLEKVFELFTQADDSNTRTHGGTGLGLNICTRLIEMMGGKLEAASEEGAGSKFYFSIPFTRATQEQVESHSDPSLNKNTIPKFERKKVLLVEDNKINKQVAEELLKAVNLEVFHASNGQECIKAIEEQDFDVVLMDIQMPVMDGFEATRILRKDSRFAELPIVAMTAHAFASEKEQSKKVGMSSHVTKPVDPIVLYNTLRQYIPVMEIVKESEASNLSKASYSQDQLLNTTAGIKRLMGNRDLFYNILIEFKNTYVELQQELDKKLQFKDKAEALKVLHQLKGAAGNIGAELLFESSQQFETSLKQFKDHHEESKIFKDVLSQTFLAIDAEMEKFQKDQLVTTSSILSTEEIESILQTLRQQIQHASPDSLTTVDQLHKMLGEEKSDFVIAIKVALQNFDFHQAAEKVTDLQATISTEVS